MRRLNRARVALKHHGTMPSKLDIEAFRGSTTNFFEDNTGIVFGIRFTDISLVDLVQCKDAKNNLKEGGKYYIHRFASDIKPTPGDVQFCINFVIETAIILQQFDFSIKEH